jgi:hypothetical protein
MNEYLKDHPYGACTWLYFGTCYGPKETRQLKLDIIHREFMKVPGARHHKGGLSGTRSFSHEGKPLHLHKIPIEVFPIGREPATHDGCLFLLQLYTFEKEEDLEQLVEIVRPLRISMILENAANIYKTFDAITDPLTKLSWPPGFGIKPNPILVTIP